MSASEDADGDRQTSVPPGTLVEREEEEEDKSGTENLAARVQQLAEQMREMRQRMWEAMGFH